MFFVVVLCVNFVQQIVIVVVNIEDCYVFVWYQILSCLIKLIQDWYMGECQCIDGGKVFEVSLVVFEVDDFGVYQFCFMVVFSEVFVYGGFIL